MIAGKNRKKEQEGRKMSASMLCYLPKHSLERACTLCIMLGFGEGKRKIILERMNHFLLFFCEFCFGKFL